ncbi:MAG: GNAT family N-acetyltransferase [Firmicutes bacterium]|nr:GNAT family N-acetyltransferase [Bacillota bacterium]
MTVKKEDVWFENSITIEDFLFLRDSVGFQDLTEEEAKRVLANTTHVQTAWYGGQCVGMVRLLTDYCLDALITDVIVHPNCQGQGIGYLMMENLLNHIKENLASPRLACLLYANKGKEPFYESLGLEKLPNERYGYGMMVEYQKPAETE